MNPYSLLLFPWSRMNCTLFRKVFKVPRNNRENCGGPRRLKDRHKTNYSGLLYTVTLDRFSSIGEKLQHHLIKAGLTM